MNNSMTSFGENELALFTVRLQADFKKHFETHLKYILDA